MIHHTCPCCYQRDDLPSSVDYLRGYLRGISIRHDASALMILALEATLESCE